LVRKAETEMHWLLREPSQGEPMHGLCEFASSYLMCAIVHEFTKKPISAKSRSKERRQAL